jgi:superoxide dismutase
MAVEDDEERLLPPVAGLITMRIAREFGSVEEFSQSLERSLARGGGRGATIVAALDRGDLGVHIPREDGPSWNTVPLIHLRRGDEPSAEEWAAANAIIEKLERYR